MQLQNKATIQVYDFTVNETKRKDVATNWRIEKKLCTLSTRYCCKCVVISITQG
jgi:hypothetical protein